MFSVSLWFARVHEALSHPAAQLSRRTDGSQAAFPRQERRCGTECSGRSGPASLDGTVRRLVMLIFLERFQAIGDEPRADHRDARLLARQVQQDFIGLAASATLPAPRAIGS